MWEQMKSKSLFKWFLIGAFSGYFAIHPLFMGVGHLMGPDSCTGHSLYEVIFESFSLQMIPWGLLISFTCGLIGYLYGRIRWNEDLLRNAKKELEREVEERTEELLKANQQLRTEIIERKKAANELIERARHAELGAEIGKALVTHGDLRSQLQLCTESIVKHLDAAFARIWVLNKKENLLELMASAGMYTRLDGCHSIKRVGELKIGIIAKEKKPHLTNTVIGDPMISDQEWANREGMIAFAGHPLVLSDKVLGVMAMFSKKPLHEAVCKALASISDEIALGIERQKAEDRIHFLAYYDSLTGLPNRYFLEST
jgi:hypothetical protein